MRGLWARRGLNKCKHDGGGIQITTQYPWYAGLNTMILMWTQRGPGRDLVQICALMIFRWYKKQNYKIKLY